MPLRLQVDDLACTAGTRVLFEHLGFALTAAQALLLMGPNGSGKTTLLRALAGLARPSAGQIRWFSDASPLPADAAGLCLYQGHLPGWKLELGALENLTVQCRLDGIDLQPAEYRSALQRAGIGEQADLLFARLSAGQRRRVALARLMLDKRKVWLLDEPTTALDDAGVALLAQILDQHLADGGIAIVASHHELSLTGRTSRLHLGQPDELADGRDPAADRTDRQ